MFCNFLKNLTQNLLKTKNVLSQDRLITASVVKDMDQREFTMLGGNANWHKPGKLFDSTYYSRLDTHYSTTLQFHSEVYT